MKAVIVNDMIGLITGVDEDGDAVAEFGGSYQLQISKQGEVWRVTNGVNGYGNNCRDEFKDATVTPLYETPAPPDGEAKLIADLKSEIELYQAAVEVKGNRVKELEEELKIANNPPNNIDY